MFKDAIQALVLTNTLLLNVSSGNKTIRSEKFDMIKQALNSRGRGGVHRTDQMAQQSIPVLFSIISQTEPGICVDESKQFANDVLHRTDYGCTFVQSLRCPVFINLR